MGVKFVWRFFVVLKTKYNMQWIIHRVGPIHLLDCFVNLLKQITIDISDQIFFSVAITKFKKENIGNKYVFVKTRRYKTSKGAM